MTPQQLRDLFRTEFKDSAKPYLVSEASLYEYMTDAQREFVRLSETGIPDAENLPYTQLTFPANDGFAELSPLVMEIRAAFRDSDGKQLAVHSLEDFVRDTGVDVRADYGYSNMSSAWRKTTAALPTALILGVKRNQVRAYPIPTAQVDVNLEIYRLPICTFTESSIATDTFEIDEQHHRHLWLWMAHLAHNSGDVELRDATKAEEYKSQFESYCARAKNEIQRARRRPATISYGGI